MLFCTLFFSRVALQRVWRGHGDMHGGQGSGTPAAPPVRGLAVSCLSLLPGGGHCHRSANCSAVEVCPCVARLVEVVVVV